MMARSGLRGAYSLTEKGLNENVTRQLPGAYALGRSANGKFYIDYVGRSDSDVKKRLHDHIGENPEFNSLTGDTVSLMLARGGSDRLAPA